MDTHTIFITRSDLNEMKQELLLEMTHFEHRLINKVGAIVIGTASVMMFLNNLFDRLNQCITLFVSADGDAKILINPR